MKIGDLLQILKSQYLFNRTMSGRSINEDAAFSSNNTINDTQNLNQEATICLNCKYVNSSLQFPNGCPNCGGHDIENYK